MQSTSPSGLEPESKLAGARSLPKISVGLRTGLLIVAGLTIYISLFLDTVKSSFIGIPFGDAYDFILVEFRAQDQHNPGLYLWQPHNGHHLVWIRLLTHLDVALFHGRSTIFAVAALIAIFAAVGLLSQAIWRNIADRRLAATLIAVPTLALLTAINAIDVSIPVNVVYVFSLVFAVAAILMLENDRSGFGAVFAILALIAGAAMGNSVGLAAVPVAMIAVARRKERGKLPLLWIAGPALAALFIVHAGQLRVEVIAPATTPTDRIFRDVHYFLSFCGLPWSASSSKMSLPADLQTATQAVGPILGLVVAAVGMFLVVRAPAEGGTRTRLDRICCDLILFSLAAAAMAALGRADASAGIPVRYGLIMAPLHIGVLILLAIRVPAFQRLGEGALTAVVAIVLTASVAHQIAGRYVIVHYSSKLEAQLRAFNAGRRDPAMTEYIYPQLAHAEEMNAEMKKRGVYQ